MTDYRIRIATLDDLSKLLPMGSAFFHEADLPGRFQPRAFLQFWSNACCSDVGFILLLEASGKVIGTLGALLYADPCDGALCAQELFWWVNESHRGGPSFRLIDAFEKLAKHRGAQRVLMAAVDGPKLELLTRIYARRGYRPAERNHVKEL